MATNQIRGMAQLLSSTVGRTADQVEGVHRAVSGLVFDVAAAVEADSVPLRALHDGIVAGTYTAVRAISGSVGVVVGAVAGVAAGDREVRLFERTRPGTSAIGALNGLFGDSYERDHPDLDLAMGLRFHDAELDVSPEALARRFGSVQKVSVFVHGLASTDQHWFGRPTSGGEPPDLSYGDRLQADLGHVALYLRYNTGRHISDNGQRLAELLGQLVAAWPVPIDDLVLVGHSMGGLVIRSACDRAAADDADWLKAVHDVVLLGSPHRGAPLERLANRAAAAGLSWAVTRPVASVLRARSVGIKDLRWGYLSEGQWAGRDADDLDREYFVRAAPPAGVRVHHVVATLTASADRLVARTLGDLLVTPRSALDRDELDQIDDDFRHVGRVHHLRLLRSPEVYAHLHAALAATRPG